MKTITIIIAAAAALAACNAPPKQDQQLDENCILAVERIVTYGGETFKKLECVAWSFGPTKRQQQEWNQRNPPKAQP